MTKEGTGLAADLTPLISGLFALIPVPVALVANDGRVVLSNSAFSDLFQGTQNIQGLPHHVLEIAGRGIYVLEPVPFNDEGIIVVYASVITYVVKLYRRM